ncbi:MAG: hypothetical protein N3A53_02830, partial [Verrucomicrobiae bacterium]|nr:hypothetical protein [Verrucomicrobiae bacterium]
PDSLCAWSVTVGLLEMLPTRNNSTGCSNPIVGSSLATTTHRQIVSANNSTACNDTEATTPCHNHGGRAGVGADCDWFVRSGR